ncbi:MAG: hypothetical protein MZV63_53500 [Marinilabiliales bacterium]|nr:hypothetical protein [Marinilabiliales bacterium]
MSLASCISQAYAEESEEKRVLITYVSAYGYTREMAELIARGASEVRNVTVEVMDIETADIGEIDSKLTIADGINSGLTDNQSEHPAAGLQACGNGQPAARQGQAGRLVRLVRMER